ncbi:DNA-binding SARP family transcriptional activator [Arthrobacter globiformis]|uniref:AfsR/SARP family transcriptional regulator n=1 Tax=Arthrobacter globiformis TaxID=1665 RepID=UPI002785A617|nr:BTAD domain-containing putative transcriptional regulator [Arthrobacter globiformis]MDQ1060412.1 DNA-binding SARP family transcriptional activator [Arthrobacter globiformis]
MGKGDYGEFRLSLLQSWQLISGAHIVRVSARQQKLITALALYGPRPRSYLIGLLWPECSEPRALESLRVSLHLVRKQVPGLLINSGAVLSLSDEVDVDLNLVRAQIRQLSQQGLKGNAASCLQQLSDAELLPGWYEDWIVFEQTRLRQGRLRALLVIATESLTRCDYETAVEASEAALELEPLYEKAVGILIQAERQQGNNAAAYQAFERYEMQLKADTGLVPSETIRGLMALVRWGDTPG